MPEELTSLSLGGGGVGKSHISRAAFRHGRRALYHRVMCEKMGVRHTFQEAPADSPLRSPRRCGLAGPEDGRQDLQVGWYRFIARHFCPGSTVLDVGAGLGRNLDLLDASAQRVDAIDPGLDIEHHRIRRTGIDQEGDRSFDLVLAVDVIEHVVEDQTFFDQLMRVARQRVVITTPNGLFSRCLNPFHCREYTPRQALERFSLARVFLGDARGDCIRERTPADFLLQGERPGPESAHMMVVIEVDS